MEWLYLYTEIEPREGCLTYGSGGCFTKCYTDCVSYCSECGVLYAAY